MQSQLNKQCMLTMSTAHITEETAEKLGACAKSRDDLGIPVYDKGGYGWFIYLDSLKDDMYLMPDIARCTREKQKKLKPYGFVNFQNLPDDLVECLMFAIHTGADVLCLDQDEQPFPYLATYDW